jgi:16S rRNA (guanine(966)-N(2))-methyltransferase RsmD
MRIIAGEFRSRKLTTVEGVGTRPTPDRLRESLFSILGPELEGKVFADAYAGTGAVGIEALSRGARLAIFLESDRKALEAIRQNLKALKAESRSRLIPGPAARNLTKIEADILFLDPPYTKESEYAAAMNALHTPPPALVILQHSVRFEPAPAYGPLTRYRILKQGENALSFYRP